MPPASVSFHRSFDNIIFCKGNLTIFNVPPTIFIAGKSIIGEINLSTFQIPPAVLVLRNPFIIKVYFSILDTPPAISIFLNSGMAVIHNTVYIIIPVSIRSLDHTIEICIRSSIIFVSIPFIDNCHIRGTDIRIHICKIVLSRTAVDPSSSTVQYWITLHSVKSIRNSLILQQKCYAI